MISDIIENEDLKDLAHMYEVMIIFNNKEAITEANMGLNSIIDKVIKTKDKALDYKILGKTFNYHVDALKYKTIGDEKAYNFFKKAIKTEYQNIKTDEVKEKFRTKFSEYLPKTWL